MAEMNPYAPPRADLEPPVPTLAVARAGVVPPASGWARWATVGLGLFVPLALVSVWIERLLIEALRDGAADDVASTASLLQAVGVVDMLLYVGTAVCFLGWTAGACRTARSIAPVLIRETPTWAVVWWFIPFANLYKPYAVLRRIWQVTMLPSGGADDAGAPAVFRAWWAFFVLRLLLTRLAGAMFGSRRVDELITAAQIQMVSEVVTMFGALTAIAVIRKIHLPQVKLARPSAG